MLIEPPSTETAVNLVQTAIEAAPAVAGLPNIVDDADNGVVHIAGRSVNGGDKPVQMAAQESAKSAHLFIRGSLLCSFVRPARTASSSRPAVSTAVARGGGQGGPKGTA